MIIKFLNTELINIKHDSWLSVEGCPTCDYGKMFCTDFEFHFSDGNILTIQTEFNEAMSIGSVMSFFANRVEEFKNWGIQKFRLELIKFLKKEYKGYEDFRILFTLKKE